MNPRLYLETTIPSYLVARPSKDLRLAADQQATKEWWEQRRHDFDLFVSEVVFREARRGDAKFAEARIETLRGIAVLSPLPEAEELTERLLRDGVIPPVAADDAAHLGFAAAHGLDYLLTMELPAHQQSRHRAAHRAGLRRVWIVVSSDCNSA